MQSLLCEIFSFHNKTRVYKLLLKAHRKTSGISMNPAQIKTFVLFHMCAASALALRIAVVTDTHIGENCTGDL
jgi:hypothetical protein